ncbi:chemotaxis protein CheA [Thauera aromatica]|uniref:Chemotaxis protein CheA n=1 Tax=Thauera aromatica K172 TaxID=44139 RepID=A0A2R4BJ44_THAAR|nr:chemotaxis protein CheA [Thauera aromatica]AVR87347.1 signal transduction histidine kinase CheA [Thauera aromatica K172]
MDISEFLDSFFEEAVELLADMEGHLLELDCDAPDAEQLNAIFRAAHSIKGGAGAFGFQRLQETTHIFENLLDHARRGELTLRKDIVDLFLETKDMLQDQLEAYRSGGEPDQAAFERICRVLQQLALEEIGKGAGASGSAPVPAVEAPPPPPPPPVVATPVATEPAAAGGAGGHGERRLQVSLLGVAAKDRALLLEELAHLGTLCAQQGGDERYDIELLTAVDADDIEAVLYFIIEAEQLEITPLAAAPAASGAPPAPAVTAAPAPAAAAVPAPVPAPPAKAAAAAKGGGESSSIRVPVEKVDQIINLVGELIITQSMLEQTASGLDDVTHTALLNDMGVLQRNARDLQEAVMSIRMVPMDYVFSRYPRLVRDLAGKLDKDIELVTEGESTELDRSLTERIIDPLTHLVRNSLDHGIEPPAVREAAGKPRRGRLTLSAQHQGGNILIEVSDDGAGLNRDKLLAKAREKGLAVADTMTDDEVWQLIFAPGFSTAEQVSDVSGRGVGMDVVKRNIQSMGGRVEIFSRLGEGTTTRIVLPLTLAILEGMSIRVGEEVFVLPLSAVLESLQPKAEDLHSMGGDDVVLKVRGEYLSVIPVHEALAVAGACTDPVGCIAVIVQAEGRRHALLVDELIGQQQVVVKNLETNYRKVPGVSAATILGDGRVALILDIGGLHRLSRDAKVSTGAAGGAKAGRKTSIKEVETL